MPNSTKNKHSSVSPNDVLGRKRSNISDEPISPNKIHNNTTINLEEMIQEVANLDLQDLDSMLSKDKSYRKSSMIFLQSLIGELKKTKTFKNLVDKSAKEKLREEDKKGKLKE